MTDSFLFSATAILPILLIALTGYFLKRFSVLSEEFFSCSHKLVFHGAMPALIFYQIYQMDFEKTANARLFLFCVLALILCYALGMLFGFLFVKDRRKAGAMAQGMTRSTFSIVGLPLAQGLFGEAGLSAATLLLAPVVIINNVCAVIILSVFHPDKEASTRGRISDVFLGVLKNPLIWGMLLAFLCRLIPASLPQFVLKAVDEFGSLTQPLALLCLGAGFAKEGLAGRLNLAIVGSVVKTVVCPLLFVSAAILFGLRGVDLGLVCILFGGPTTISSYIMAKNMQSDEILTGQIVLLSTLLSTVTLFAAFFFLRVLGLI